MSNPECHRECPFDCGWSTDDVMNDYELAAVEGGADRLALHLRIEHQANPSRDDDAWKDGSWMDVLFPGEPLEPLIPPLRLRDHKDD